MASSKHEKNREWAELSDGCYLLRTNLAERDAATLWKTYIGLTQIEDSFRISKHDLGLRPIYHHKQDRAQAHILVCFLALVMWRTLQQWMNGCGLGDAPRVFLEHMAEVRSLDIVLPTGGRGRNPPPDRQPSRNPPRHPPPETRTAPTRQTQIRLNNDQKCGADFWDESALFLRSFILHVPNCGLLALNHS